MFKRLFLTLVVGAVLLACTPSGGGSGSSTNAETLAPVASDAPSDAAPSVEASASPS